MPRVNTGSAVMLTVASLLGLTAASEAQTSGAGTPRVTGAVAQWIALPVAPGYERAATDIIAASMPGWTRDAQGNLIARRGSGSPRRVIACGLDEAAYVVSQITADGYLRLQYSGRSRRSPLWDQFYEGQRIRILSRSGSRPAVVAVRSVHLSRGRTVVEPIVRIEDLWVDVGARNPQEVARLGIAVLDPVVREWPAWPLANAVAGPAAGDRAGCAAVAGSASGTPTTGETIWILSAQHAFGYAGLLGALARLGPVDTLILVDPAIARDSTTSANEAITRRPASNAVGRLFGARARAIVALGVRTTFGGTQAEVVRESDVVALEDTVAQAAGLAPGTTGAHANFGIALRGVPGPPAAAGVSDSLTSIATLLATLSNAYGVSGSEGPVREAVKAALPPAWRNQGAHMDSAGDLIVAAGPDRDTVVVIAHLDEIGFEVRRIERDGMLTLAPLGGFYNSLWEGQPALLHVSEASGAMASSAACPLAADRVTVPGTGPGGALRGVFVPRSHATTKEPDTLSVWLGVDSAGLSACGVTVGTRVTGYKQASRLGSLRFTARAIDDRAGCTALLTALATLDPAHLPRKVIFVWSVREEVGLDGAAAVAAELGTTVRRVHAIDTFVSSDSPLESPRFGYAMLGSGATLRSLDNSSVTPPDEVRRALRVARAAAIPVQFGATQGGNDGSAFVPWGAVDVAIGWPLRYSHSPAEVIDLRDIRSLARIVAALVVADPQP